MKVKKLKPAADKVKNCKNWHISRINCKKRRRRQLRKGILVWDVKKLSVRVRIWQHHYNPPPPTPTPHNLLSISHIPVYLRKKILSAYRKDHRYWESIITILDCKNIEDTVHVSSLTWKGFSPVWTTTWWRRACRVVNFFSQTEQTRTFSPVKRTAAIWKNHFIENIRQITVLKIITWMNSLVLLHVPFPLEFFITIWTLKWYMHLYKTIRVPKYR